MKTIKRNGSWAQIIKEQLNVKNTAKLQWMTQYAQKHDMLERRMMQPTMIGESLSTGMNTPAAAYGSNMAATPGNTMGMGNFGAPQMIAPNADGGLVMGPGSNTGGYNSLMNQIGGSGDQIQQSTVPVALWVAANTPGLDLVGVVNANGPVQQFQFLDFPYAGGKFGRNNEIATLDGIGNGAMEKPSYVKFYAEKLLPGIHVAYTVSATQTTKKEATQTEPETITKAKVWYGGNTWGQLKDAFSFVDASEIDLKKFQADDLSDLKIEKVMTDAPSSFAKGTVNLIPGTFIAATPKGELLVVEDAKVKAAIKADGGRLNLTENHDDFQEGAIMQVVKPTRQGDALICKTIQVTAKDEINGQWNDGLTVFDPTTGTQSAASNTSFGLLQKVMLKGKDFTPIFDLVATGDQRIAGYTSFSEREEETVHGWGRAPMSRGENETGTGNIIGARTFQKWIEMDSSEIQGTVTRQQVQDMKVQGIDVVGRVLDQMANELTQEINTQILTKLWRLGRMNHDNLKKYHGYDLDLNVDYDPNTDKYLTDYMRYGDKQRRIQSRLLAAINVISAMGRYGRPNWIITNVTTATALQDSVQYEAAPIENEISQMADMYMIGTFAGLQVYVDPMMDLTRNQILVGRRTSGEIPGVIFMPYILAETVSIIAEGTMANKMLMNSRYAVAEVGFAPETQYYAFEVFGQII